MRKRFRFGGWGIGFAVQDVFEMGIQGMVAKSRDFGFGLEKALAMILGTLL